MGAQIDGRAASFEVCFVWWRNLPDAPGERVMDWSPALGKRTGSLHSFELKCDEGARGLFPGRNNGEQRAGMILPGTLALSLASLRLWAQLCPIGSPPHHLSRRQSRRKVRPVLARGDPASPLSMRFTFSGFGKLGAENGLSGLMSSRCPWRLEPSRGENTSIDSQKVTNPQMLPTRVKYTSPVKTSAGTFWRGIHYTKLCP
jgi:hypothetical protein